MKWSPKPHHTRARKMMRKFTRDNTYTGAVGVQQMTVLAKTKHAAVKKLRLGFLVAGIKTQPDPLVDLLVVTR